MIKNVAIIGAGNVGTSFALALVKTGTPVTIRMTDVNAAAPDLVRQKFAEEGLSSAGIQFYDSTEAVARDSDLHVVATQIDAMGAVAQKIGDHAKPGSIVIDTGSAKQLAIPAIDEGLRGRVAYVPCHPGNGSQGSGPLSASPDNILGPNSWMFVVHDDAHPHDADAARAVKTFLTAAGIQVTTTDATTHDRFFGRLSHLQHAIVFSQLGNAENNPQLQPVYAKAGKAFRNATRIALSTPSQTAEESPLVRMWSPILTQNREAVLEGAGNFLHHFHDINIDVAGGFRQNLVERLQQAREFRFSITDPREREGLDGELAAVSQSQSVLKDQFNTEAHLPLVYTLLRPYMVSVSQTLNAKDLDPDMVRTKANPSFRDGTYPAMFDPDRMADLLMANRDHVGRSVEQLSMGLLELIEAACHNEKNKMAEKIFYAQKVRDPLGPPDWTVRGEYKL